MTLNGDVGGLLTTYSNILEWKFVQEQLQKTTKIPGLTHHSIRQGLLAGLILAQANSPETLIKYGFASCVHDAEKASVENPGIYDSDRALSDEEFAMQQQHVRKIVEQLKQYNLGNDFLYVIASHHEKKRDRKKRYPRKDPADTRHSTRAPVSLPIKLTSEAVAIADCSDAILYPRKYNKNLKVETFDDVIAVVKKELDVTEKLLVSTRQVLPFFYQTTQHCWN